MYMYPLMHSSRAKEEREPPPCPVSGSVTVEKRLWRIDSSRLVL
jgi:hypothetical protein